MADPRTKTEIIEHLGEIHTGLLQDIKGMSEAQFTTGNSTSWSAADYLKHLLLSVKPVSKVLGFPLERIESQFGRAENPSRSYSEVVAAYQKRLDEGARAEDYEKVVPAFYRFPDGISDTRTYLMQSWAETNTRLAETLHNWSEADLDRLQIPHPAIGMTTVRELLFFTIFHNTLHWHDIQHAGGV